MNMEKPNSKSDLSHVWESAPERSPVKDLHDSLKPREELERVGRKNLSDAALIAIILRSGTPGKNVIELARHILVEFGGLEKLAQADHTELVQHRIRGLGPIKAKELSAAMELGLRIATRTKKPFSAIRIENPLQAYKAIEPFAAEQEQENFWVLLLDTKNKLIREPVEVSQGLIDSTPVHPREIFTEAIRYRAKSIILVHNHPSGDPTPSSQDLKITRRMIDAARLLDIPVRDHLIVGWSYCDPPSYLSLKEHNLIDFEG
ncbi:MAG: DNA repair protein RadC [Kiritimatiellae bacterium]|nr:DNA repair protein RadC [Kiritimatiellia bacterium]